MSGDTLLSTTTFAFSANERVHMLQRAGSNTFGEARLATVRMRRDNSAASVAEACGAFKYSSMIDSTSVSPQNVGVDINRLRRAVETVGTTIGSAWR